MQINVQGTKPNTSLKRIRIKNSVGSTIHQYRVETDRRDVAKNAAAFPPNLIHSIDSCILCLSLKNLNKKYNKLKLPYTMFLI